MEKKMEKQISMLFNKYAMDNGEKIELCPSVFKLIENKIQITVLNDMRYKLNVISYTDNTCIIKMKNNKYYAYFSYAECKWECIKYNG